MTTYSYHILDITPLDHKGKYTEHLLLTLDKWSTDGWRVVHVNEFRDTNKQPSARLWLERPNDITQANEKG